MEILSTSAKGGGVDRRSARVGREVVSELVEDLLEMDGLMLDD